MIKKQLEAMENENRKKVLKKAVVGSEKVSETPSVTGKRKIKKVVGSGIS